MGNKNSSQRSKKKRKKGTTAQIRRNNKLLQLMKEGEVIAAIDLAHKFFEDGDDRYAPYYSTIGHCYLRKSPPDVENALEELSHALELNDALIVARISRGFCYKSLKEYNKALEDYTTALELLKEDRTEQNLVMFRTNVMNRAQLYDVIGDYEKAIDDYTLHIEYEGEAMPEAHNNRGLDYLRMKDYGAAQSDFEEALTLEPHKELYRRNLALVHKARRAQNEGKDSTSIDDVPKRINKKKKKNTDVLKSSDHSGTSSPSTKRKKKTQGPTTPPTTRKKKSSGRKNNYTLLD